MRKLVLPALAACSLLAAGAPAASAKTAKAHSAVNTAKQLSKVRGAIKGIKKGLKNIENINLGQTSSIHFVDGKVDTVSGKVDLILAGVPTIVDNLTKLGAALEGPVTTALGQLGAGLTAIQTALNDPVTGLVGLNNARPQFGAFNPDGTIIAGTGQHPPAKGPSAAAVHTASTGQYLVNFGNDVSERMLVLTMMPTPPPGTPAIGQAVTCGNPTATPFCNAINGGTLATPENWVLVTVQDHGGQQCVRNAGTPLVCNASGDFVAGALRAADWAFYLAAVSG